MTIIAKDNHSIHVHQWMPQGNPKALVLISHGISEHGGCYEEFAQFLNKQGYGVFAPDHRGHGESVKNKEVQGYFADTHGWERVVEDFISLAEILQHEYKGVPLFLLGHSMGTFIIRDMLRRYKEPIQAVILDGTGYYPFKVYALLKFLAKMEIARQGRKAPSFLIERLITGRYNRQFRPNRTEHDWLSRDEKEVDRFEADPLRGFVPTAGYFFDLARGLRLILDPKLISQIPDDLPILIYSGDKDSLFRRVPKLYRLYRKIGLKVSMDTNRGGRHESLHEINRKEVFNIYFDFFQDSFY